MALIVKVLWASVGGMGGYITRKEHIVERFRLREGVASRSECYGVQDERGLFL